MAIDSNRFPLQNAIKKILDNPNTRPALPDGSSTGGGSTVGDGDFSKGDGYDTGISPDVALNNGNVVVEVHETQGIGNTLWCHVGKVEGKKITWGGSIKYDNGVQPSVAITNDGLVVEVHKSENFDTLYYNVGRVHGDNITWGGSNKYDDGVQPSVAITNSGLVVEVHKSENFDTLYYHVGRVEGDKITWGGSNKYDDGIQPSVAITDDGLVVEVHQSQSHDTVWYRGAGQVNGNTITWHNDKSQNYSDGKVPKVACNAELAVEAHNEGKDKLLCSVLTLPAYRPTWSEERGRNSYYRYSLSNGLLDLPKERSTTNKIIKVDPGASFLIAHLSTHWESIEFPKGAMLIIELPNGQTKFAGEFLATESGGSLQSLIIKEPTAGDYQIILTVPAQVPFLFTFETLPFENPVDILEESKGLQQRDLGKATPVLYPIAAIWTNVAATQPQNLTVIQQAVGYLTASTLNVTHTPTPTSVTAATQTITQNIQIPNIGDFITPPGPATSAPITTQPVIDYVRNQNGALLWLHARITQAHLGTGTVTNQQTRDFARRLGLPTDDAGHVIGNQLGGLGNVEWNIIPQNPNFNRGVYASNVESVFRRAVQDYGNIEVWFRFYYNDTNYPNRPDSFEYCMRLPDGTILINDIYNPHFVPPGS